MIWLLMSLRTMDKGQWICVYGPVGTDNNTYTLYVAQTINDHLNSIQNYGCLNIIHRKSNV